MSRVGKHPVIVQKGVNVELTSDFIKISGPKGKLVRKLSPAVKVTLNEDKILVSPTSVDDKFSRSMWGTTRRNLQNAVIGVSEGYTKTLEVQGVGYKASVNSKGQLVLSLGFSHDIIYIPKEGVKLSVANNPLKITVDGFDKEVVGQTASKIRALKKPEPFKGKGIRYEGEFVRRKEGKKK